MLTILNNLDSVRDGRSQRRAVLLKITRTDGLTLLFTDHSSIITFDGEDYEPVGGFATSAEERQTGLRERSSDTAGVVTSDKITEADLLAGLYDDAMVEKRLIDWRYPWLGSFKHEKWWIDSLTFTAEQWRATMQSWLGRLRKSAGDTVQRVCPYSLGDASCGVSLGSFTRTGEVPSGVTIGNRTSFECSSLNAEDESAYRYGLITFTTGDNAGQTVEVKDNVLDGGNMRIDLQLALPFDIQLTDEFTIVQGCDKLFATCRDRYSNGEAFGGYPFVPGTNKMINPLG